MKPIISLGEVEHNGKTMSAAYFVTTEPFTFDAPIAASFALVLYNCFEGQVEEEKRAKFQKDFRMFVDRMFEDREKYSHSTTLAPTEQ